MHSVSFVIIIYIILLGWLEQIHFPGRQYGATGMLIVTGQSKAKRRVLAFLTVFVMTGILSKFKYLNTACLSGQIFLPLKRDRIYSTVGLASISTWHLTRCKTTANGSYNNIVITLHSKLNHTVFVDTEGYCVLHCIQFSLNIEWRKYVFLVIIFGVNYSVPYMGHHHLSICVNNMHMHRIPSMIYRLSLSNWKDVWPVKSKKTKSNCFINFFPTDFILSYMYMIVEATVLPAGPTQFNLSEKIVAAFYIILGLQVSSMTLVILCTYHIDTT